MILGGELSIGIITNGEVPEWTNGAVSKTVVVLVTTVGSNPTLSAERAVSDPPSALDSPQTHVTLLKDPRRGSNHIDSVGVIEVCAQNASMGRRSAPALGDSLCQQDLSD